MTPGQVHTQDVPENKNILTIFSDEIRILIEIRSWSEFPSQNINSKIRKCWLPVQHEADN